MVATSFVDCLPTLDHLVCAREPSLLYHVVLVALRLGLGRRSATIGLQLSGPSCILYIHTSVIPYTIDHDLEHTMMPLDFFDRISFA
jgi:hypothetical protein